MTKYYEQPGPIQITGLQGALIELSLYFVVSTFLKYYLNITLGNIIYYWLSFTVLTGIWELTYTTNKEEVAEMSLDLLKSQEHVWTKTYNLSMILPHNLAKVFYSEYAAYSDHLYYSMEAPWSKWSLYIEGTHCLMCGLCAFLMFISMNYNLPELSEQFLIMSMSFQAMNSILYMTNYFIQMRDHASVNYVCEKFPKKGRGFMLINIFWTIMPLIILFYLIYTKLV